MPALILHFFDKDDPNGATIFECSTDDAFVKQVQLKIERDSMGGGTVNFARKTGTGLISRNIVVPETLVRVVIPEIDSDKYLWGFFINPRQQQVVSKAEKGGEGFTFGGPGPKHYLSRAVLRAQSFTGIQDAIDDVGGVWVWPETASAGRILSRLISEDAASAGPTTMLPDLTKTFNLTQDSDSVAWVDDISSNQDFTLSIGDDFLKLMWILEDASGMITHIDLGSIGDPRLQLEAWQTKGRDLTGDLAVDTVHFIEGVNIASDLNVEGQSFKKASHALVIGDEGQYTVAARPGWSAGELKRMVTTRYPSSNDDVLERMGQRFLNRQENGERQINLKIVPGFDPENGLYMFGPPGTDGHFFLWDTVDLTTGQSTPSVLDYQAEPQAVTGIHVELEKAVRDDDALAVARSFDVKVILNNERKSSNTAVDLAGNRGSVKGSCSCPRLCKVAHPGTDNSILWERSWDFEDGTTDSTLADYEFGAVWVASGTGIPAFGTDYARSTGSPTTMGFGTDGKAPCTPGGTVTLEGEIARNWFSETFVVKKYTIRWFAGAGDGFTSYLQKDDLLPPACSRSVAASYSLAAIAPVGANYFSITLADNAAHDNVHVVSYDTDGTADVPGDTPAPVVPQAGDPGTSVRASRCDHKHAYHHPVAAEIDYENDASGLTAENVQTAIDELASAGGGGGAPTTVDYLVGTASGSLSAEIVVGTTPGGELGGTWASPTVDSVHSGSAHLTIGSGSGNAAAGNHTHTATAPSFVSVAKWGND